MKNYLKNKTILVSGATSGIGEQLALDLFTLGANLILIARNTQKLESIQAKLKETNEQTVSIFTLDVRDRDAVKHTISKLLEDTTVDILINNAGLALGLEPIDDGDIDQWEDMIDTNLKGLLYLSRNVIEQMRSLDTAHIVNLGSVAGRFAYPNGSVYCATKAAVHSLGESMNADLLGTNVKVTTIAPGAVDTNFSNVRFSGDTKKADAVYEGFTPLSAQDISDVIINVINTPKHVNIQYLDIMPTAQRNPYLLHRTT